MTVPFLAVGRPFLGCFLACPFLGGVALLCESGLCSGREKGEGVVAHDDDDDVGHWSKDEDEVSCWFGRIVIAGQCCE